MSSLKKLEVYLNSGKNVNKDIDSLYHSRNLKRLVLSFDGSLFTNAQARKVFRFLSDTNSLEDISVTLRLSSEKNDPFILDISRHHDLTDLKLSIYNFQYREIAKVKIIVGEYYDHLYTDLDAFILKRTGKNYQFCSVKLPFERTIFAPVLPNDSPFTKFGMDLKGHKSQEDAARTFSELTLNMTKLRHIALSTHLRFKLSLETTKLLFEAIKERPSLETLRLNFSIKTERGTRSNERIVIDLTDFIARRLQGVGCGG